MLRTCALATLLACLTAFGADQKIPKGLIPDEHNPSNQGTDFDKCQAKCGEGMSQCMMPCVGGNPEESAKPENRSKTMACVKKCAQNQEPCMKACDALKKKK